MSQTSLKISHVFMPSWQKRGTALHACHYVFHWPWPVFSYVLGFTVKEGVTRKTAMDILKEKKTESQNLKVVLSMHLP